MLSVSLLALAAACATAAPGSSAPSQADASRDITALLTESTDGWNRGDLDAFLVPYLAGGEVTYVGSGGLVRGKDAIRRTYAGGWFAPGRDPGRLRFENIEVRLLGADHALAVGRYVVERTGAQPATGMFSLTLRRTAEGWRIIHDHSS